MPKRIRSPVELMKYLPGKDCNQCGFQACFLFAMSLLERTTTLDECTNLTEEQKNVLKRLLAPPMREITIGTGDRAVKIGGEEVVYRHELSFFNPTAIAIDVWDTMSEDSLTNRVKEIEGFQIKRFGKILKLDAIAVRSVSGNVNKFTNTVSRVSSMTNMPLILCSLDPNILKAGLKVIEDKKPLLYAATKENWRELLEMAKSYGAPVVLSSPGDINTLGSLSKTFSENGVPDIILDPGTFYQFGAMIDSLSNFMVLRRACVEESVKELSYPVMGVPAFITLSFKDPLDAVYAETSFASALIVRGVKLLIMHSLYAWNMLSLFYLRQGVYTHPKVETSMTPGIYPFNNPNELSPLMVTSNYTLTYGIVSADIERHGVPAYLLVIDTKGLSVDTAVGSGDFSAENIADAIDEYKVKEKIKHRVMIIPQVAAEIVEDLKEDLPEWEIIVGPRDSSEIGPFLKDRWKNLIKF